jgi:hypothetical protein
MANFQPVWSLAGAQAAADLSTKQFYAVKKNTTAHQYALCDTDGEVIAGVLQNKPSAAGREATIMAMGITKVIAGETLVPGDLWGCDSAGKAKVVEGSNTGADTGDYVAGFVIEGAATDEIATVTIGMPTFRVESV